MAAAGDEGGRTVRQETEMVVFIPVALALPWALALALDTKTLAPALQTSAPKTGWGFPIFFVASGGMET